MYELLRSKIGVSFSFDFRLSDTADKDDDVTVSLDVGCFANFHMNLERRAEQHEYAAMTNAYTDATVSQQHHVEFPFHLIVSSPITVENLFHELVKRTVDETETPKKYRLRMLVGIRDKLMETLVKKNPGWRTATIRADMDINVEPWYEWRSSTDGCCPECHQEMVVDRESGEAKACAVCLNDFSMDDDLEKLTCGHCIHGGCIRPWIKKMQDSCPLCRAPIFTFADLLNYSW